MDEEADVGAKIKSVFAKPDEDGKGGKERVLSSDSSVASTASGSFS